MQFCNKCGAMLIGKTCGRCGSTSEEEITLEASQKIDPKKEVIVVNDGEGEVHPIVEISCEKCKHPEAYFWTKQTRAGDEAETKFYKCVKCSHTWRVYR